MYCLGGKPGIARFGRGGRTSRKRGGKVTSSVVGLPSLISLVSLVVLLLRGAVIYELAACLVTKNYLISALRLSHIYLILG